MKPIAKYFVIGTLIAIVAISMFFYYKQSLKNETNLSKAELSVIEALEKNGLYHYRVPKECTTFYVDFNPKGYADLSLYENNTKSSCSGDPAVANIIDRFKVFQKNNEIYWYDVVNDTYLPIEVALSKVNDHQNCTEYSNEKSHASEIQSPFYSEIVASGRTQFYSAPSENCLYKGKFVIQGDSIQVLGLFDQWAYVSYENPETNESYYVWILSSSFKNHD